MLSFLTTLFGVANAGGNLFGELRKAWQARLDAQTDEARLDADIKIKQIEADIDRQQAASRFSLGQMNHPIWWAAWIVFVLPIGVYHAAIFFVSTFPFWGWPVERVPPAQEEWARLIVLSIFGAQIVAGGLGSLIRR